MTIDSVIQQLNERQKEVVLAPEQPMLVLAGAGSGKTRVLVARIAWLLNHYGYSLHAILAVTFTNKAAREMRGRLEEMLSVPSAAQGWIGTFHGIGHRLLRRHWQEASLPQSFQILDSEDQHRLIKRLLKTHHLDEGQYPPKKVQWFINAQKDAGVRAYEVTAHKDPVSQRLKEVYQHYETACEQSGLVDFGEILLRSVELLERNPSLLAHYQQRFRHILVDEFQDTNAIQYRFLKCLAEKSHLTVIGDDDQSIYGWRGARIENIQHFQKDYPAAQLIRLEQNYRSTKTILSAANTVIAQNEQRIGKDLWTEQEEGAPVALYEAFNDIDEARFIVSQIQQLQKEGYRNSEIAILYRSNAQSRALEEALLQFSIPYRIYGGQRFFERAEIKDALAYLRLIHHPQDDGAFERVVNTPPRGIGDRTVENVRLHARQAKTSLWDAMQTLLEMKALAGRAHTALLHFMTLIQHLQTSANDLSLTLLMDQVIERAGLIPHYLKEGKERGQARVDNLKELVNAASEFVSDAQDEAQGLTAFLSYTALEAGEAQADPHEDSVQLMTLHMAKGLEFPCVFLCGMEEGLFPHQLSAYDENKLAEERRLCYVGMTRAMKQLYLTYAEVRRLHGQEHSSYPSRFIREIPAEFIQEIRFKSAVPDFKRTTHANMHSSKTTGSSVSGYRVGDRVEHKKFGAGHVLECQGEGARLRLKVRFQYDGVKWIMATFLSPLASSFT